MPQMSEDPLGPDLRAELEAQARWRRDQARLEASLAPEERTIRLRFEKALFGPESPPELEDLVANRPETLLAIAQAYMDESHNAGRPTMIGHIPGSTEEATGIPILKDNPVREEDAIRYMTAAYLMIGIWMATRGHQQFIDHFSKPVTLPVVPPVPYNWERYLGRMCAAFGTDYTPPEKVTRLFS